MVDTVKRRFRRASPNEKKSEKEKERQRDRENIQAAEASDARKRGRWERNKKLNKGNREDASPAGRTL